MEANIAIQKIEFLQADEPSYKVIYDMFASCLNLYRSHTVASGRLFFPSVEIIFLCCFHQGRSSGKIGFLRIPYCDTKQLASTFILQRVNAYKATLFLGSFPIPMHGIYQKTLLFRMRPMYRKVHEQNRFRTLVLAVL